MEITAQETDGKYTLYGDTTKIVECTLAKFVTAMNYDGTGYEPALHKEIEGVFNLLGEPLDWDELRDAILHPVAEVDEEEPIEELPEAPEWTDLLEDVPDYREYAFEVIMSFMASHKDIENPPWLGIVAPPSTGKTFILKQFDHPYVGMLIDDFTDNALAPGRPNRDAADVESMLDEARGINLIINDVSSVFSQRPEKVNKFIGSLTTAYGGTYVKFSPGSGADRHTSETTLFMGMTNRTYKKHRKYMGMLGSRFLFLTFKRPEFLRHREDKRSFDPDELRLKCCAFQQEIINKEDPTLPDEVDDYLFDFVHKVIVMRNIRWISNWNELEGESRLYQQIIELCKTRAKIHNRDEVTKDDVDFFKPLCYETIPYTRNIMDIYNGAGVHHNNKWTKAMLKNAIHLRLTKVVSEEEKKIERGFHSFKEVRRTFTWNDEYMDFLDDMNVMYTDDGDEED